MLLATEPVPSSQVSTSDVSYLSPSYNTPCDQYKLACNDCEVQIESAKTPIAMAKIFVTVNDGQAAASMRERDLIEQSLAYWCGASRTRTEPG